MHVNGRDRRRTAGQDLKHSGASALICCSLTALPALIWFFFRLMIEVSQVSAMRGNPVLNLLYGFRRRFATGAQEV